jgi:hypothetical protein
VVKASTLRDYGVDNFFFLENKNTDTSQRNVVFIARGESAGNAHNIAGELYPPPILGCIRTYVSASEQTALSFRDLAVCHSDGPYSNKAA